MRSLRCTKGAGKPWPMKSPRPGGEAMVVLCDVSKSGDVAEMVNKVVAKFGGIDILVNNAALTDHANIFDSTEDEFDKVIAVSLKGPYLVTKYVAAQMKRQGRGGRSSILARHPGWSAAGRHRLRRRQGGRDQYDAGNGRALAPYKIRVNCVVPNRSGSPDGYDDDVTGSRTFENLAGRLEPPMIKRRRRCFW